MEGEWNWMSDNSSVGQRPSQRFRQLNFETTRQMANKSTVEWSTSLLSCLHEFPVNPNPNPNPNPYPTPPPSPALCWAQVTAICWLALVLHVSSCLTVENRPSSCLNGQAVSIVWRTSCLNTMSSLKRKYNRLISYLLLKPNIAGLKLGKTECACHGFR